LDAKKKKSLPCIIILNSKRHILILKSSFYVFFNDLFPKMLYFVNNFDRVVYLSIEVDNNGNHLHFFHVADAFIKKRLTNENNRSN